MRYAINPMSRRSHSSIRSPIHKPRQEEIPFNLKPLITLLRLPPLLLPHQTLHRPVPLHLLHRNPMPIVARDDPTSWARDVLGPQLRPVVRIAPDDATPARTPAVLIFSAHSLPKKSCT